MDKILKRLFQYTLYAIVIAQAIVPLYLTVKSEIILAQGKEFKFRVRPVDPYDPFRGRYTSLGMMQSAADVLYGVPEEGSAYAVLQVKDSFAETSYLTADRPAEGADYVQVRIDNINTYNGKRTASFRYPFDRIFYNEKIAPEIDKVFWSFRGIVYVTVFIKDGTANIGKLYFDGVEAEQYVKKLKAVQ
jgi:uncharacterized membrane-anchored protein